MADRVYSPALRRSRTRSETKALASKYFDAAGSPKPRAPSPPTASPAEAVADRILGGASTDVAQTLDVRTIAQVIARAGTTARGPSIAAAIEALARLSGLPKAVVQDFTTRR